MPTTQLAVPVVVAVVLIIGAVPFFASGIGVAAPLALTVVGVGLGAIPALPHFVVKPELVPTVILSPLLYAAALAIALGAVVAPHAVVARRANHRWS